MPTYFAPGARQRAEGQYRNDLGRSIDTTRAAADAIGYGDRPRRLTLLAWRPIRSGALIGRAKVLLPIGLEIADIGVFERDGRRWAQLPAEMMRDAAGQPLRDAAGDAGPLTTCPECHAIRMRGQPCAVCGWAPRTRGVAVDVIDGDLGLVDRDRRVRPAVTDPRRFYAELVGIAARRGYKPGWAAHKYRERHGMWPPWRHVQPEAPSAVTLAWVRSRQIAYARARSKGAA